MNNKTTIEPPASVIIDDKTITRKQFENAMLNYGDEEGYSYDGFALGMTWLGIVNNSDRGDGQTEREVWLPLLGLI